MRDFSIKEGENAICKFFNTTIFVVLREKLFSLLHLYNPLCDSTVLTSVTPLPASYTVHTVLYTSYRTVLYRKKVIQIDK